MEMEMKGRISCLKKQLKWLEREYENLNAERIRHSKMGEINWSLNKQVIYLQRYINWLKEEIKKGEDKW
jgi:hypothetical protein